MNVLAGIVLGALGLVLTVMLLLDVGCVQRALAGRASRFASQYMGTTVSVKSINLTGYNRITIGEFYVEDYRRDTILYVQTASARVDLAALIGGNIVIDNICADRAKVFLHDDDSGQLNITQIVERFNTTKSDNPTRIELRTLQLTNSEFRFLNDTRPVVPEGVIDWGNMQFTQLNAQADELIIVGSHIEMELHGVSLRDRSGAVIEDITMGRFVIDNGLLEFTDAHIKMPKSDLTAPIIKLSTEGGWKQWKGFVDSVRFDIRLEKSSTSAEDLRYFVPFLHPGQDFMMKEVTANYEGVVNDFGGKIENALIYGTRFEGSYHVRDVVRKPIWFDGEITGLNTSAGDIGLIAKQFGVTLSGSSAEMLARTGSLRLSAAAKGLLTDFAVQTNLSTDLGYITAAAEMGIAGGKLALKTATASSDGFDVGYLTKTEHLGRVSFTATGNLHSYTATIAGLNYNNYIYHNIAATGTFDGKTIAATVISHDSAALFTIDATYSPGPLPTYRADLNASHIDLHATRFNLRDSISEISGIAALSGSGIGLNNLTATATVSSLQYKYPGHTYTSDSFTLTAANSPAEHSLILLSEPVTAEYHSSADYRSSFGYLADILYVFLPALPKNEEGRERNELDSADPHPRFEAPSQLIVRFTDINPLLNAVVPQLSIARESNIRMDYDPVQRNLSMNMVSDFVEWNNGKDEPMYLTRFQMEGHSAGRSDSLHLSLITGKSLLGGVTINSASGTVMALNNHSDIHLEASADQMSMSTNLNGVVDLGRNDDGALTVRTQIAKSTFSTEGETWELFSRRLDFLPNRIDIEQLRASSASGHFYVDGALSNSGNDTLKLDITNLELEPIVKLFKIDGLTVEGTLNGQIGVSSLTGGTLSQADMVVEGMRVNGCEVVPLSIKVISDAKHKQNKLSITTLDGKREFARGYLRSDDGEYMVRGTVHGIPVAIAKPFFGGALTGTRGEIDIDYDITSQKRIPIISQGSVVLRDVAALVSFNNITYSLDKATISIVNNIATLPETTIGDGEGHFARLTARADLRNFASLNYSAHLQADNLAVLNTTYSQNQVMYGKLSVSGRFNMAGDTKGMNVTAVAETTGGSFHLPMTGSRSVINDDFITFESLHPSTVEDDFLRPASWREPTEKVLTATHQPANINIALNLTVRPNTEVNLVLDPTSNDGIEARGDAVLNLQIAPRNNIFTIDGSYVITEGEYTLSIQGITKRTFIIQQGSNIRWSGEPLDPQLNVRAIYTLRTSLTPLRGIIGVEGSYGRVPVECIVSIGNHLTDPSIAPDIRVRLSDPQDETNIANALATQDTKLTQFAWLVAFGEFFTGGNVTDESVNFTDVGLSTAAAAGSGLLTSEINKLINAHDGLSFSIDYHPRTDMTSNEFVFGFTKKLSDNLTLQLNGDFDTGDNPQVSNVRAGTLIPDASLMWDMSSHLNGRLFYRPIEQWNSFNKGTGEFGAGISYHTDFNTFKELFKKKIKIDKKSEQ